ncbi:sialate O-acetylesterase [Coraliomargarita algicola]|uniref:Sialate O-acetylesterase n=1 Tax=Coraliomargarita algicola TaxID=3092156 RepID=A0ABZ0RNB6_9BACT|nr:sialate O-acetylesterase [Coraliomargarita sp. J2-16]WPJ96475.1 sialate O-acetylesterase [Coraliomargarita sp. J2-16]
MNTKSTPPRLLQVSFAASLLLWSSQTALAELKLPAIFGSHMVLQQEGKIPVWGWEDPGETITVSFAGESVETTADESGQWKLALPQMATSHQGQSMTIHSSSGDRITYEDVLVGEVWICSGQSNMEWSVANSNNSAAEAASAHYPEIRYFDVKNELAYEPQEDLTGHWVVCSPDTVKRFSAVGYYFGRHLHSELDRPVGLISTNWGGTIAEAWTSKEALIENLPEFTSAIDALSELKLREKPLEAKFQQAWDTYKKSFPEMYALEADLAAAKSWTTPELDDSQWATLNVPQNWEQAGHKDLDGIVWLRKTIELPASWAGRDLALHTGPIDEVDVTWFNSEVVGQTGNLKKNIVEYWNQPRSYQVPGKLVKAGKNVIAIRVMDAQGQGGLWGGEPESMYIAPVDAAAGEQITLASEWKLKPQYVLPKKPRNPLSPNKPTVLYNQMIQPLIPFGIRGAIWYQGESNSGRPEQYRTLLPTMIADWRQRWGRGDFPFLVVQLANYRARDAQPVESKWAELREAQAITAAQDPNTGLAVTIDIGEANDIHPRNKQDVGHRLGLVAERIAYQRNVIANGPTFQQMKVEDDTAILSFDHATGGLVSKNSKIGGFALKADDGDFVWAQAEIHGSHIHLRAPGVNKPVAARYAWANNPEAPLYNQAGLPMVPFRTDAPED